MNFSSRVWSAFYLLCFFRFSLTIEFFPFLLQDYDSLVFCGCLIPFFCAIRGIDAPCEENSAGFFTFFENSVLFS